MPPLFFWILLLVLVVLLIFLVFHWIQKKRLELSAAALPDFEKTIEPLGFSYDKTQNIFYSRKNCWQKNFGYCRLYDKAMRFTTMVVQYERVPFDYGDRHWLIEFWKGQYGICTGAEVGVYYINKEDTTSNPDADYLYRAAEEPDYLPVSMRLYHKRRLLFVREDTHWWLTGFVPLFFTKCHHLQLNTKITFPSSDMQQAFLNALSRAGYPREDISIRGQTVCLRFIKPSTTQHTTFYDICRQWKNALFVFFLRIPYHFVKAIEPFCFSMQHLFPKLYHCMLFYPHMQKRYYTRNRERKG